jgi:hypothetical protein
MPTIAAKLCFSEPFEGLASHWGVLGNKNHTKIIKKAQTAKFLGIFCFSGMLIFCFEQRRCVVMDVIGDCECVLRWRRCVMEG